MTHWPALLKRDDTNIQRFVSHDASTEIICALTNSFVQLHDVPWEQMQALASEYADAHDAAFHRFFLQPNISVRKPAGKVTRSLSKQSLHSPEALQIQTQNKQKNGKIGSVSGWYCTSAALSRALQAHELLDGYKSRPKTITAAWHILSETIDVQTRVVDTMISGHLRNMDWIIPSYRIDDLYASEQVLALARTSTSTEEFLGKVCAPLVEWFADPVRKGRNGVDTYRTRRPVALLWFAMWLTERGYLVFPINAACRGQDFFALRYRSFYREWIQPEEFKAVFDKRFAQLSDLVSEEGRDRALLLLIACNLVAPGLAYGKVSAECLELLRSQLTLSQAEYRVLSAIWKLEAMRLKEQGFDPQQLQALTNLVVKLRWNSKYSNTQLWAWVDDPNEAVSHVQKYVQRNLVAGENLLQHVGGLRDAFPAIAGRSADLVKSSLSVWLYFLASLPDELVPPRLTDLRPALIESIRAKDNTSTFRGFMAMHALSAETQKRAFSTLKRAWQVSAVNDGAIGLICPISDQTVSLSARRTSARPATTTRRAIDMDILELLIQENRADDFAFSRTREYQKGQPHDHRWVKDPESGKMELVWWPGVAVLMDLLLQIPIRHKQGRFLDSGEGDEFQLDIQSLELTSNPLASAERGCNQAFIQRVSLSPLRDEPGLGMFINTNKTGRDYTFPWLLPDIAENVQRVIDWQKRYNPISAPVSDRDDSEAERAAKAEFVLVYPIFRDVRRHDNGPVSSQIVLRYFRSLLKHVEEKYNLLNGTNIRLFGVDGEPVYDIHALRVTGVTRLLSMGVDPRIVRLLVGHASLAMMWYYDHLSNHRVADAMRKALELRKPNREALLDMNVEQRERFFSRLFSRSEKPSLAITLLRGLVEDRAPFLDVRVDGICPGKRCADADVWRPRACSLCKFHITGAPFLAGLELVLNNLMAELILAQKNVARLRDQFYQKRTNGESISTLEAEIVGHEELVDNILQQWEAQFHCVKRAETDLATWLNENEVSPSSNELAPIFSTEPTQLGLALQEAHHLALFTGLIEGAKRVHGFVPAVGARETRDAMLLEIVRHESKIDLFYKLNPEVRAVALDQFALLLLEESLPSDSIAELIRGSMSIASVPTAMRWLESLSSEGPNKLLGLEDAT